MVVRKRAMDDDAKLRRKEKIFKSAWQLMEKQGGRLPTVAAIARKTGLSKGCVYLYFSTKNEIFIHLYVRQLGLWHETVKAEITRHPDPVTVDYYAQRMVAFLVANPMLLKMGSILTGVLEEGMDEESLLTVKLELARLLDDMSQFTATLFPGLDQPRWLNIHLQIHAMIFGLWQLFYSTPHVRTLVKRAGYNALESDFSKSAVQAVTTFIKGSLGQI